MAEGETTARRDAARRDLLALALALGALTLPVGGLLSSYGFFAGSTAGIVDYSLFAGASANVVGPLLLVGSLALLSSGGEPGSTTRRWAQLAITGAGALMALLLIGVVLDVLFRTIDEPTAFGRVPGGAASLGAADQVIARGPSVVLYGASAAIAACTAWWATGLPTARRPEPEGLDG